MPMSRHQPAEPPSNESRAVDLMVTARGQIIVGSADLQVRAAGLKACTTK